MLSVAAPLGLLALAGIPAIVALHLFRRSYRPRTVSALFLWGADARAGGGGRVRQPLKNRLSLWCEILACCALAWLLADVRVVRAEAGRHLVLIVDSRWSMQARPAPTAASAWDQARDHGLRLLAGLDPSDRASVIATGTVPRLIAGPAVTAEEAAAALNRFTPDQGDHDQGPALALATQLGGSGAELLLLSDRVPLRPPRPLGWAARGQALPTTALAEATWREEPGQASGQNGGKVLARVVAAGAEQARGWQLVDTSQSAERVLAQGTVSAAPGRPALISAPVPANAGDLLTLRLIGADPLTCDDACRLRRPVPRRLTARVSLPEGGLARRAVNEALTAVGNISLPATGIVDLEFAEGPGLPGADTWRMSFVTGDGPVQLGPFLARAGHPLLDGVDASGLLWAGAVAVAETGEDPLLTAAGRVLIGEVRVGPRRELRLHADWGRAQLHRHPAWPALIANWCALRRAWLPGPERSTVRLGEGFTVQVARVPEVQPNATVQRGADSAELIAPDGVTVRLGADLDGRISVPGLDRVGTWRLRTVSPATTTWAIEANALDARLADLTACTTADQPPQPDGKAEARRETPPLARLLPLLLAGAALAVSWFAHRRETGAP